MGLEELKEYEREQAKLQVVSDHPWLITVSYLTANNEVSSDEFEVTAPTEREAIELVAKRGVMPRRDARVTGAVQLDYEACMRKKSYA